MDGNVIKLLHGDCLERMIRNGDNVKGVINFQYWVNINKEDAE